MKGKEKEKRGIISIKTSAYERMLLFYNRKTVTRSKQSFRRIHEEVAQSAN